MPDVLSALFGGWYAEPVPLVAAATAVVLYDRGARRLAAAGSPLAPTAAQRTMLGVGVAVILVALLSPIDDAALRLQWMHMVQHVLLLVVAAPLIVLGRPWETTAAAFGARWHSLLEVPLHTLSTHRWRVLASAAAVIAFVGVLWVWHIPGLYDLTLRNDAIHNVEHTAFLAIGLLFWTAALPRRDEPGAVGMLGRAVVVLVGMFGSWMLAIYIGYAPTVLYAYTGSGNLTATADQQVAAGVMWVPASLPFVLVLILLGARWFENDARAGAAEHLRTEAHA